MTDLNTVLRLGDDVRFRIIGDEALVVCQERGEILAVNETGSAILQTIDGSKTALEIIETIRATYDVPPEEIEQDVLEFIADMQAAGVFEP